MAKATEARLSRSKGSGSSTPPKPQPTLASAPVRTAKSAASKKTLSTAGKTKVVSERTAHGLPARAVSMAVFHTPGTRLFHVGVGRYTHMHLQDRALV